MPYTEHSVVKAGKLAETGAAMLEQELTLPNLFRKESFDAYQGNQGDAVNVKVEGVLPFHNYGFRNDRSAPLKVDTYSERSLQITIADHFYSNVHLTDEQVEWDLIDQTKILGPQVKAVARGLQRGAASFIENAPYEVVIGGAGASLRGAINEARRVMNKLQVPAGQRVLVVGSDFESEMLADEKIVLAQNVGDSRADSALGEAVIGRVSGFTVVLDNTIQSDAAYAFVSGGFVWANAAPYVPQSVGYGATTSFEGVGLRIVRNYDHDYVKDRQLVDTWSGFRVVEDVLVGWDPATNQEVVSDGEHFVRGVKLTLDGQSAYPTGQLSTITGLSGADGWENGVRGDISLA